MNKQVKKDWVGQIGDTVEKQVRDTKGQEATIICASGISPSGPVHLGNLREVMTVHLVAEELRARGHQVEHLHFWDDYDRLRKIPSGVPDDFARYLGCPLVEVPDPSGEFATYAERYSTDFTTGLARLGIFPHFITQSEEYRKGRYAEQITVAMEKRSQIFDILAEYQTREGQQETVEERRAAYYPYKVYCENCQKDLTTISSFDSETAMVTYHCENCQHQGSFSLHKKNTGKLVWKADWPMRWAAWKVDFEPAGADHAAPNSSFRVGQRLVEEIYDGKAPKFYGYAFIGMEGRAKISSSAGTSATLTSALDIIEPPILRWLYTRRAYNQAFNVDFGQGLLRLYNEWDGMGRQVAADKANDFNRQAYERACVGSRGALPQTPQPIDFSLLASVLDITQGNNDQVQRIASLTTGTELTLDSLEPRLTCARNWIERYLPDDERTTIRTDFAADIFEQLPAQDREGIRLLVAGLDDNWSLAGLTSLVYNVPKMVRNLPLDTKPDDELKQAQRSFFIAVYQLLCASDTGPRIPTLLLSLGKKRVKSLLGG
jgi:lysyl-tRNA synthetase class 1